MKTFYIYDMQTDEQIYEVQAFSVVEAEIKACVELNRGSNDLYALTDKI